MCAEKSMMTMRRPRRTLDGPRGELASHSSIKSGILSSRTSRTRRARRNARMSFVDLLGDAFGRPQRYAPMEPRRACVSKGIRHAPSSRYREIAARRGPGTEGIRSPQMTSDAESARGAEGARPPRPSKNVETQGLRGWNPSSRWPSVRRDALRSLAGTV